MTQLITIVYKMLLFDTSGSPAGGVSKEPEGLIEVQFLDMLINSSTLDLWGESLNNRSQYHWPSWYATRKKMIMQARGGILIGIVRFSLLDAFTNQLQLEVLRHHWRLITHGETPVYVNNNDEKMEHWHSQEKWRSKSSGEHDHNNDVRFLSILIINLERRWLKQEQK